MIKTVATIIGVIFLLVGLVGFASPNMMDMHLSTAHNVIHLVSGAISLYFGLWGSVSATSAFAIIFGAVYLLLGIFGFIAGGTDGLFRAIPGTLVLGMMDHIVHLALGAVYLVAGFASRRAVA